MDGDPLGFGDGGIDTTHFAHMDVPVFGDVIDRHGDFIGVPGEHEAGRPAFVQDRHAISVSIGESFIGKLFHVIEPDSLAADFVADGAGSIDEGTEELERLFAHREI
jgi:hypothetical protein